MVLVVLQSIAGIELGRVLKVTLSQREEVPLFSQTKLSGSLVASLITYDDIGK